MLVERTLQIPVNAGTSFTEFDTIGIGLMIKMFSYKRLTPSESKALTRNCNASRD